MMGKIISSSAIFALIIAGCGAPEPVELDGDSAISINRGLIEKNKYEIPKDSFLKNNNWTYNLSFEKIGKEFIPNDMVVKTFYVAHNAAAMIIIGNEKIAKEYKSYFVKNGCDSQNIVIHDVDSIGLSKNRVNVLFFGKKQSEKDEQSIIQNFNNDIPSR